MEGRGAGGYLGSLSVLLIRERLGKAGNAAEPVLCGDPPQNVVSTREVRVQTARLPFYRGFGDRMEFAMTFAELDSGCE